MADTLTPNIRLTNQTEGGNNNSWGSIADANFEEIDDKFGDVTAISTTGGTTTLTVAQEIVNAILVSGTLVSNVTIVFSGRGGSWVIKNATTGDFTVTVKVSGQSGVEVAQGTKQPVYYNGTDIESAGGSSAATSIPSGFMAPYLATTAPSGWVRANARTISNAAGGGTERANADTETLFLLLWANFANTELAIQDSAGSSTTRGASAAADYAANKRLPLPDLRGRSVFGLDTMGNSAASRLGAIITNSTTNGASGGSETSTLTETNLAPHAHGMNSHTHGFSGTTNTESAGHTHGVSGTTAAESAGHTHGFSGTTSGHSADHSHGVTGATGAESAGHTHSGTTGNDLVGHTHDYTTNSGTANGQSGGNFTAMTSPGISATGGISATHSHAFTTAGASASHTHAFSVTSGGASADHTHTYSGTTGGASVSHTHTFSVTSAGISNTHTHTFSGTTDAAAGDTASAGSGTAFSNMPPCLLTTWIIKL